jgi:hypothetical protein
MSIASAALRYRPTASAAITVMHSAISRQGALFERRGDEIVEVLVAREQRHQYRGVEPEEAGPLRPMVKATIVYERQVSS